MSISAFFSNGIGNFVLASPAMIALAHCSVGDFTCYIPDSDPRIKAIASIAHPLIKVLPLSQVSVCEHYFSFWGFDLKHLARIGIELEKVHTQSKPDFASGANEEDSYREFVENVWDIDTAAYGLFANHSISWNLYKAQGQRLVAIANGCNAKWGAKRWPFFGELCKELEGSGVQFVFVGDSADTQFGEEIKRSLSDPNRLWNFAGKLSLAESAGLVKQCDVLVCNDTALMHVANAIGTPVVALFGPTYVTKNGPRHNAITIQSDSGGCRYFKCLHTSHLYRCADNVCMQSISSKRVASAVRGVLQ